MSPNNTVIPSGRELIQSFFFEIRLFRDPYLTKYPQAGGSQFNNLKRPHCTGLPLSSTLIII